MNSVCICGLVKNCAPYLTKVISNIETIGLLFSDYRVIIAYDNSSDNSLEILEKWSSENSKVVLYKEKEDATSFRVYNITRARNNCLDILRKNYSNYEYCTPFNISNADFYIVKII